MASHGALPVGTAPMRGGRVKNTTALARCESAKEKPWTSPLCGGDQGWLGRNCYANGAAGSHHIITSIVGRFSATAPQSNVNRHSGWATRQRLPSDTT